MHCTRGCKRRPHLQEFDSLLLDPDLHLRHAYGFYFPEACGRVSQNVQIDSIAISIVQVFLMLSTGTGDNVRQRTRSSHPPLRKCSRVRVPDIPLPRTAGVVDVRQVSLREIFL